MDKHFNLIDEKWILVLRTDYAKEEVSLTQLFQRAHTYRALAGELPTQDVAILRLLLAILYAVFLRRDEKGVLSPITVCDDEDDEEAVEVAFERWHTLWQMGHFPSDVIDAYLKEYHERFWLFHPERPFYQVAGMAVGTEYSAAKLNGTLSESREKKRLFPNTTGKAKEVLSCAEAARWLPYVIAFDDMSSKAKQKNLPSPGAGWLGKLGLLNAQGKNLFETLMLNLALLKDGLSPWQEEPAAWELERPRTAERVEVALPENPAALYTLQSRRICLLQNDGQVSGYLLLGGDFFDEENAFSEQMTYWMLTKKKQANCFQPKRHQFGKQMWRDFASLIGQNNDPGFRQPGIILWTAALRKKGIIPAIPVTYHIASVQYGGELDSFVKSVFEDALILNVDLLSSLDEGWRERIWEEVQKVEEVAEYLGNFAIELQKAGGSVTSATQPKGAMKKARIASDRAKEVFYYEIDLPFRDWLSGIDPTKSKESEIFRWRDEERRIAHQIGKSLVESAGTAAFAGRYLKDKSGKTATLYCAPKSYRSFCINISKCLGGDAHEA